MSDTSLKIHAAIIHQIIKDEEHTKDPVPPVIREKLHKKDDKIIQLLTLLEELRIKHGSASSCISHFNQDNTLGQALDYYINKPDEVKAEENENSDILKTETSQETLQRRVSNYLAHALHFHIYKTPKTTGDHVPIIFYEENGIDYLYFALLSLKEGLTINANTGDIIDTNTIDTSTLKVACKVNLTKLKKHLSDTTIDLLDVENYISWIQRGSSEKISEYIQDFIPVAHRLDDKKATRKLMRTLQKYLNHKDNSFSHSANIDLQSKVINLLKTKAKEKKNINIVEDIDTIVSTYTCAQSITIKQSFSEFREKNGYDEESDNNANVFAPAEEPLVNFEFFEVTLGSHSSENSVNLKGQISALNNTVRLIVEGDQKYIRIDISEDDFASAKRNLKYEK